MTSDDLHILKNKPQHNQSCKETTKGMDIYQKRKENMNTIRQIVREAISKMIAEQSFDFEDPSQIYAVQIDCSKQDFCSQILSGEKTVETRTKNILDKVAGKDIVMIGKYGNKRYAMAIVNIERTHQWNSPEEFYMTTAYIGLTRTPSIPTRSLR